MKNLILLLIAFNIVILSCKSPKEVVSSPQGDGNVAIHSHIENYLILKKIDPNPEPDGLVEKRLIEGIDTLRISVAKGSTSSLTGLEHFTGLKYISIVSESYPVYSSDGGKGVNPNFKIPLDTLDLSKNKSIEYIHCGGIFTGGGMSPLVANLILGDNLQLTTVICDNNIIRKLDVSKCVNLKTLMLSNSRFLRSVSLCKNTALTRFYAQHMSVKVSSKNQLQDFRSKNPDAEFELCW